MSRLTIRKNDIALIEEIEYEPCGEVCDRTSCFDCPIGKAVEKLAHYEDLEEQGRLKVQVHGQWEIFTDEYDCEYMLCTACGGEFYPVDEDTVDMTYNYCPNCGAKMEEGDE